MSNFAIAMIFRLLVLTGMVFTTVRVSSECWHLLGHVDALIVASALVIVLLSYATIILEKACEHLEAQ